VQNIVRKYILGLMLQVVIVAALCFAAFTFIGIEYALLLGIIAGLFNIIPYIGILTAFIFTMAIAIGSAASAMQLILAAGSMIVVHLVDSNFLLPVVVGSKVKINPLITLLGVILGEMIWGIPGMFLSIPVIAIIKIIFDRVDSTKPWGYLLGEEDAEVVPKAILQNDKEEILHEAEGLKPALSNPAPPDL
jgi:putative permease